ncbi:MAG: TetR/AcrR family transcriptional regulator [Clostridia bacterium]|nr:TetR/AcrR family transcriptional regulator [Clostridia bacterium]
MGEKGDRRKEEIKEQARILFAANGFNAVTMKDICEATGLSRGGLYRHYGSTAQIFKEMFKGMSDEGVESMYAAMERNIPAPTILEQALCMMQKQMMDAEDSLSQAIYEYSNTVDSGFMIEMNKDAVRQWSTFIQYGIDRGEFCKVPVLQIVDMILYAYQGVRMWSRVMPLDQSIVEHYADHFKMVLLG